ncbi:MAG: response regulator transcription factor [Pleomorphochaeta sp.]
MIIVIADDNSNIRFALKSMLLDILDEDETIFFEAKDGVELVSVFSDIDADLAFVDIKMPNMDGLSAIEEIKKNNEMTSFVILSGFSDFKYAKKSISLGVSDYLLKPVDEDDLKELIEKIYEEKKQNSYLENSTFQSQVFNINSYLPLLGDSFSFNEPKIDKNFDYLLVDFVFFYPKDFNERKAEFRYTKLINMPKRLRSAIDEDIIMCHLGTSLNSVQCLIKCSKNRIEYILSIIEKSVLHIEEYPNVILKSLYLTNHSLLKILKENESLQSKIYLSLDKKPYSSTAITNRRADVDIYLNYLQQLFENAQEKNGLEYISILDRFEKEFKTIPSDINLDNIINSIGTELNLDLSIKNQKSLIKKLRENKILSVENTNDLITQMKDYVEKNYMNNFGINEVAEYLNFSPNYLSTQFHKITDIYFVNYLNNYRLEKAKHLLLANSSASIKDIAMLVGYSNARYFSTLYKQAFGILPTAYRKKHINK